MPRRDEEPADHAASPEGLAALQRAVGNRAVTRMVARLRDHAAEARPVQRSSVHEVLGSPGQPIDSTTRADMETRLGASFSDVRLHTDATARDSAAEIGARAYTSGSHVVLGDTSGDTDTLAHELVHVIQQRSGPVAGTDNGAGLSVSDPSDRFEREAEQTAAQVMSQPSDEAVATPAAAGSPVAGTGRPVQRMEGFEVEVDKRIRDSGGAKIPGDADIGTSTREDFRVVSDSRGLDDSDEDYSNVEFVSGAVQVVGTQAAAGKATLDRIVDEIKNVRDKFYAATDGTRLEDMELNLTLHRTDVDVTSEGYTETAGSAGMGDGLFVQYSVGVPLSGMPSFFDHLRGDATQQTHPTLKRAGLRFGQAKEFAEAEVARFESETPKPGPPGGTDDMNGYLQLYFTQVAAMADYLHFYKRSLDEPDNAEDLWAYMGQIKNHTIVLARSPLAPMFRQLAPAVQKYLKSDYENVITRLSEFQGQALEGEGTFSFHDEIPRGVGGLEELTLLDYAKAGLVGKPDYDQQRVFGGTNEIGPHKVEDVTVIPMEIRTLGKQSKTWAELRTELHSLADWAQEAYQHEKGIDRPKPAKRRKKDKR